MHRPLPNASAANPSAVHRLSFFDHMVSEITAIWNAAWRDNRRMDRFQKRQHKHTTYFRAGLNGSRAVARRLRQIAAGQLSPVYSVPPSGQSVRAA